MLGTQNQRIDPHPSLEPPFLFHSKAKALGAPGDPLNPIPAASIRREVRRNKERMEMKRLRETEDLAFIKQMRADSATSQEDESVGTSEESDGQGEFSEEQRDGAEKRLQMLR